MAWPAAGPWRDWNRTEQGPNAFRAQILVCRLDVVDIERDVIPADVAVLRLDDLLIRRLVAEQLNVRTIAAANHRDLCDDRARIDVEDVLHERALRIRDRPERHRVLTSQ